MAIMVEELYDALRKAGIDDDLARRAARAVIGEEEKEHLATKADLSELKAALIQWSVGTLVAMTAIFSLIVKLL